VPTCTAAEDRYDAQAVASAAGAPMSLKATARASSLVVSAEVCTHVEDILLYQERKSVAEGSTADFGESMHTAPSANERLGVKKGTPDSAKWLLPQQLQRAESIPKWGARQALQSKGRNRRR